MQQKVDIWWTQKKFSIAEEEVFKNHQRKKRFDKILNSVFIVFFFLLFRGKFFTNSSKN
jgi:hypothetical protein